MRLFWRHGYEGVSISDLTNAIKIAPPSLYAAFDSKEALYREVLDRYAGLPGALSNLSTAKTLNGMVKRVLRGAVDAVSEPIGEGGCMISTGMIQCASEHADLASNLADRRRRMHDQICRRAQELARPRRWEVARTLPDGEYARTIDPGA
jgi:AcrR family transcriptional regulator